MISKHRLYLLHLLTIEHLHEQPESTNDAIPQKNRKKLPEKLNFSRFLLYYKRNIKSFESHERRKRIDQRRNVEKMQRSTPGSQILRIHVKTRKPL